MNRLKFHYFKIIRKNFFYYLSIFIILNVIMFYDWQRKIPIKIVDETGFETDDIIGFDDTQFEESSRNESTETEFQNRIENINFKEIQKQISCELIIKNDTNEIDKSFKLVRDLSAYKKNNPDVNYIFEKDKCKLFRKLRGYDEHKIDKSEYEFPLAFSILVYYNVEQLERLLKLIYRPHNLYCIHIDAKSPKITHDAIKSIVQCFDNVIISSKLENIIYAGISRLKADINCMHDLFYSNFSYNNTKWKYFINLASTEFPLRTNYELTRILRLYNGANDIEVLHNHPIDRTKFKWNIRLINGRQVMEKTKVLKSPVPYNYTIAKGIAFGLFSYEFVRFALNDKHAKELLEWAEDTFSPDEWYWATLQHNTQFNVPGGYHDPEGRIVGTKARFINWKGIHVCNGFYRNNLCIFGIGDVPQLIRRGEYFVNKLRLEYDPIAYHCMEEWYKQKTNNNNDTVVFAKYCRQRSIAAYAKDEECALKKKKA